MATTRFLIAKFVPDLRRMEPRNFGVIVWSNGQFASKFVGEEISPSGKTRFRPPAYLRVESPSAYQQWIEYWQTLMARPSIVSRSGEVVPRDDAGFLENLRGKSREQFTLVEGGMLLEHIQSNELSDLTNELFDELVAVKSERDPTHAIAAIQLRKATKRSIQASGLRDRKDFFENYPCVCDIGAASESFQFDYALHSMAPIAVLQKINLWNADAAHSTAFGFQCVQRQFDLPRERCTSLVYLPEKELAVADNLKRLAFLREFSGVVNLANEETAVETLKTLAP